MLLSLPDSAAATLFIVELAENAAARFFNTNKERSDHITPVVAALHTLPVSLRTDLRILFLVFKALNGLSPAYIRDLLTPNEHDDNNLPKNHFFYTNFLLLLCSLSGFLHCYCYALNILWNNDEICDVNQPQPTRSPWCNNRWVQTLRFFMLTCVFYVVLFNHKNTRLATGNHYFFAFEFQVFTRGLNSIQ